jgi:glucokinase
VEIGPSSVDFLVADLNGRELGRSRIPLQKKTSTPHRVCTQIGKGVRRLLRKLKHSDEELLGLAVGVPAIVNVDEGVVVAFSPLKSWTDVGLGDLLRSEFKCAVAVENDTNLAAQGEYHRGAAQGEKNFVYITIGEGVGAGIFVGGSLHRGAQWSAGEIGYLRVPNISREHPAVYKYGKLEKALGSSGILREWRTISPGRTSFKVKRAADIFDLAAAGNAQARKVLRRRAIILSDVVVDLGVILNPSLILLGGDVGNHPALLQEVQNLLKGSEFGIARVGLSALGSSAVLWGAIHTALDPAILSLL